MYFYSSGVVCIVEKLLFLRLFLQRLNIIKNCSYSVFYLTLGPSLQLAHICSDLSSHDKALRIPITIQEPFSKQLYHGIPPSKGR